MSNETAAQHLWDPAKNPIVSEAIQDALEAHWTIDELKWCAMQCTPLEIDLVALSDPDEDLMDDCTAEMVIDEICFRVSMVLKGIKTQRIFSGIATYEVLLEEEVYA